MKRVSLYSSSSRSRATQRRADAHGPVQQIIPTEAAPAAKRPPAPSRFSKRSERALLLLAGAALTSLLVLVHAHMNPAARQLTQRDIDAAVLRTLETKPLPSRAAQAYDLIKGSIVRVRGLGADDEEDKD